MTMLSAIFFALAALLPAAVAATQTRVDPARVERVLRRAAVIDLHCDTTKEIFEAGYDLGELHDYNQVDIPRMRRGHVSGVFFASNPPAGAPPLEAMRESIEHVDAVWREVRRHPAHLVRGVSAEDILTARKQGRIAILFGLEGGHVIDSNLAVLRSFYDLGARYMTLVHDRNTPWADAALDKPAHNGLTNFGLEVVREMNRLGMMIDVSHASDKTFWDTLAVTRAPVIASHSSCRVFSSHPRNMSDDMFRAVAKNGGVVHINYFNAYLDEDYWKRHRALPTLFPELAVPRPRKRGPERRKYHADRLAKLGRVPFSRLLDHFEHVAKVAGVDHVGLGSDFDGCQDLLPEGMEDISKIPNLVRGLMERGFSDSDIEKILGGNTLRAMRQVEKLARSIQTSSSGRQ